MAELITYEVSDGILRMKVCEDIHSGNAPQLQEITDGLLDTVPHDGAEFDLSDVGYISSAGLRVLLQTFKREKAAGHSTDRFALTGVGSTVNEILDMTGFSSVFRVSKALRKISLKDAVLIGDGFFSQVYRVDAENIIKVYNANASDEDIRRELDRAKYAMILGIPTAISYDIVEADGRKGVLFEMMNCGSLRDALRDHPEQEERLLDQYAELLLKLHASGDTARQLPDARDRLWDSLKKVAPLLTQDEAEKIRQLFDALPDTDTVIHGDCHVKNIMLHNGEPELIDLDTLSRGDPVIELGNICYTYTAFETLWPGNTEEFLGISAAQSARIREGLLKRYFSGASPEAFEANLNRIGFMCWFRMLQFVVGYRSDEPETVEKVLTFMRGYLRKIDTLKLTYGAGGKREA